MDLRTSVRYGATVDMCPANYPSSPLLRALSDPSPRRWDQSTDLSRFQHSPLIKPYTASRLTHIRLINIKTDKAPAMPHSAHCCTPNPQEGIVDQVAGIAKCQNTSFHQLNGELTGMT